MKEFAGKVWPLVFVVCLFVGCSLFIQGHKDFFLAILSGFPPRWVIAIYFGITLATVLIPFTSILPFLPLAVLALGWQMTALITWAGWIIGAQILFELSRTFAQPYLLKLVPKEHVQYIAAMLNKKGLPQALFVRMMVHDDFVSIAFGAFTKVTRWEFLLVTAIAVTPGAILYAYIGALPFEYEVLIALLGLAAFGCYWIVDTRKKDILRWLRTSSPFRRR